MRRKLPVLFLLILLLIPALSVHAQGAPEPINDALADLSARVGHTVALGDLARWTWSQESFSDSSLGCPQEGEMYAQVVSTGYRFELTYAGVVYDYRVPADRSTVVMCSASDGSEPVATPESEDLPSNPLCPEPEEGEPPFMRTRLRAGMEARVTPGVPNNLRDAPVQTAAVISQIPSGGELNVTAGPSCDDGMLWWQVNYNGLTGWMAEGQDGEFFVEPLPPALLPPLSSITTANAVHVMEQAKLQGNITPQVAFSPDGAMFGTIGALGSSGLWLYRMGVLNLEPQILENEIPMLTLSFSADGRQALLGGFDGTARIWNIYPDAPLREALYLQSYQSGVAAVDFHPNGSTFAAAGAGALTNAEVERENAILVWDVASVSQTSVLGGHTAAVNDVAYSPDGARLASASADGTLRIWDIAARQAVAVVQGDAGMRTVEYRSDGAVLAVGAENGSITLMNPVDGTPFGTMTGHTGAVNDVAFDPGGVLLASVGDDGTLRLWDAIQPGAALAVLQGHYQPVLSVAFSPDGTLIVTAGADGTLRLWGVSSSG